jgi:glutathione gamma-glutamylcysteinyltransferase
MSPRHEEYPKESLREKHCETCTCDNHYDETAGSQDTAVQDSPYPCGHDQSEEELPPPLPEPVYSVHKRVLPDDLIALSSPQGRSMLLHALQNHTAESYWSLMEHFTNQSDPAYCGVTTLLIVLNSMSVDPNIRWRGGWRYYGDEDVLLERCCISHERIRRAGITLQEFARLAKCQGLEVATKQPNTASEDDFRRDVQEILSSENGIIVASFARSVLGQTGEGHFSPIAAYHEESDHALVLDVARFKYAPYWVSISKLYEAMQPLDGASNEPRGWFVLHPPPFSVRARARETAGEARRPAHLVPEAKESDVCPIGKVKVHYCEASKPRAKNVVKKLE